MTESCVVIVTGMHRSGTSLVSSLVQKAGINIGQKLVGSFSGNLRGHFEDVDFYYFHEQLLNRFGQSHLVQNPAALGKLNDTERKQALALIEQRTDHWLWGWKDPRTSLFLDLWYELLPQARYLFVYRHPVEVVLSLMRRGIKVDLEVLSNPMVGLHVWRTYNRAIADFYQQHTEICLLVNISTAVADIDQFVAIARQKLELPIQAKELKGLYHPTELNQVSLPTEVTDLVEQVAPGIPSLYRQLEQLADLPGRRIEQSSSQSRPYLGKLQQLISKMASHELLGERELSRLFSITLAILAPETFVADKEALDGFRTDQIKELEKEAANQSVRAQVLQQQVADQKIRVKNLEHQISSKDDHIKELRQHIAHKTRDLRQLQQQITNKEKRLTEKEINLKKLQQQVAGKTSHVSNLEQRLTDIEKTRAWRLATKWYSFKNFIRGSRRPLTAKSQREKEGAAAQSFQSPVSKQAVVTPISQKQSPARPKILFISHQAYRTGAPIILLHFLQWLQANHNSHFEILLKDGNGPLRSEFEALAPTIAWNELGPLKTREYVEQSNFSLIFANTVDNGNILATLLSRIKLPVICHVHELAWIMNHFSGWENVQQVKTHTDHYIAVSQSVKQNLVESLGIPEQNIDLVYEFISMRSEPVNKRAIHRIYQELGLPDESFIVGGCGTTEWRKGPDLFVQLTRLVHQRKLEKPVHFIWVGGDTKGPEFGALWHDVKEMGVEAYIHFIGRKSNPLDYFAAFDLFAMVSREDPFPIVNIETAMLGKPIVCFDGGGGSREFVSQVGNGFVVPYLDMMAMADKVVEILKSPNLRQQLGQQATEKVHQYDVTVAGPKILQIIKRFLPQSLSQTDEAADETQRTAMNG